MTYYDFKRRIQYNEDRILFIFRRKTIILSEKM